MLPELMSAQRREHSTQVRPRQHEQGGSLTYSAEVREDAHPVVVDVVETRREDGRRGRGEAVLPADQQPAVCGETKSAERLFTLSGWPGEDGASMLRIV